MRPCDVIPVPCRSSTRRSPSRPSNQACTRSGELPGIGAGVLIRALEPLEGVAIMQQNRGIERVRDLARGPGRLAAALQIDRRLDGLDLCRKGPLWLAHGDDKAGRVGRSIRIGISRDAHRLLRFYLRDSPFVSGPKSLNVT